MSQSRPNIIIVYTDQQRYDTLGVNGNERIRTPNLDAMAREGVRFTRGYVTCPICVPSRVGLWTGRYNHTNLSYNNARLLRPAEIDFATQLRRHGYHTMLVGKDHCFGGERRAEAFAEARTAHHGGWAEPETPAEKRNIEVRNGKMQVPFADDPVPAEESVTAQIFREAQQRLGRLSGEQPFLLWLSIPDPHPPYMVCEPYASIYDDVALPPPAWREGETADKPFRQQMIVHWNRYDREYGRDGIDRLRRIYWGMVSMIDEHVGRLFTFLQERGLDEDTVVVFTSDHGDYMGDHRMIRKGVNLYEALVHVPLIVRWPGCIEPRATDAMTCNLDILPTLAAIADVPCPEGVQGLSLLPVLTGASDQHRTAVFLEHGNPGPVMRPGTLSEERKRELGEHTGHHLCSEISQGRVKGVRTDRWKFSITPGDVDELYDMQNDPDELHNLADDPHYADVVRRHRDLILQWLIQSEETRGPVPHA